MMECEGFGEVKDKKRWGKNVKGTGDVQKIKQGCEFSQPLRKSCGIG